MFVAILLERANLIRCFTLKYVDDDQAIMWNAALEYSKGNFYEPFFFGQNYGVMLESLLAIPLIKIGFSYAFSLSTITSILILFPFLSASIHYFSKERFNASIIILAIPLLLPPEYGMISSIPRGFVPGIFISYLGTLCLLRNIKGKFFFFSFFSFLGLVASPNSVLLILPFAIVLFYHHFRSKSFYIYSLSGAIIPIGLGWLASNFYKTHPEYIVHNSWEMKFSFEKMHPSGWSSIFEYVTPLFWYSGIALFTILVLLLFIGIKQKKVDYLLSLSSLIILMVVVIANNKVHDGIDSVFYSSGRMFLVIPLLISLFLAQLQVSKKVTIVLATLAVISFALKLFYTTPAIEEEVRDDKNKNVYVLKIDELNSICKQLKAKADEYNTDLIIILSAHTYEKHMLNYACPCLIESLPITIEHKLDRRTWRLKEVGNRVYKNVLLIGVNRENEYLTLKDPPEFIAGRIPIFISTIDNNQLKTETLLQKIGSPMRHH